MKRIKLFEEFFNEAKLTSTPLKKLAIAVGVDFIDNRYIYDKNWDVYKVFELYTKTDKSKAQNIPVLNYGREKTENLIKAGYDENLIYNKFDAKERVSSKSNWYKLHENSKYIVKTVYSDKNLKDLSFPIIAKPDNKFSGQGITIFKNESEIKGKDLSEFAIFSEMIDIRDEIRIFCWMGKPIMHTYRIPANKETKNLSKDPDEKLKFRYELSTEKLDNSFNELIKEFSDEHADLHFYSIDIAVDTDGNKYVIEMSSEPGPVFGVMELVYREMYLTHFKKPLSPEASKMLDNHREYDINQTIDAEPDRFKIRKN
jgi:hypothetical protein